MCLDTTKVNTAGPSSVLSLGSTVNREKFIVNFFSAVVNDYKIKARKIFSALINKSSWVVFDYENYILHTKNLCVNINGGTGNLSDLQFCVISKLFCGKMLGFF